MKVLIIGFGSIAQKHLHALRHLRNDVTVFALRSGKSGNVYASDQVTNVQTLEELPVRPDVAIISNPTACHFETIEKLLALKVPLFIEKPLFHTLEGGEGLVRKCLEQGVMTYVACNLRFHPCIVYLSKYLEGRLEEINEVNVYCGSYLPEWRPNRDFRTVYSADPAQGGGVHLDLIHELDYTYWLLGAPDSAHRVWTSRSTLEIPSVDFAQYQLSYGHFQATVTLNYYRRDVKREIEIVMKDGTVVADLIAQKVRDRGETVFESSVDVYHTYIAQMQYFIEHMQHNSRPMNDIGEAFSILKICLS